MVKQDKVGAIKSDNGQAIKNPLRKEKKYPGTTFAIPPIIFCPHPPVENGVFMSAKKDLRWGFKKTERGIRESFGMHFFHLSGSLGSPHKFGDGRVNENRVRKVSIVSRGLQVHFGGISGNLMLHLRNFRLTSSSEKCAGVVLPFLTFCFSKNSWKLFRKVRTENSFSNVSVSCPSPRGKKIDREEKGSVSLFV